MIKFYFYKNDTEKQKDKTKDWLFAGKEDKKGTKANAEAIGRVFDDNDPRIKMNRASTDLGNISKVIASIHPYIGVNSGSAVNHQKEFAAACITADADQAVLDASKAMAMTLVEIASDPALREYVKGYSRP